MSARGIGLTLCIFYLLLWIGEIFVFKELHTIEWKPGYSLDWLIQNDFRAGVGYYSLYVMPFFALWALVGALRRWREDGTANAIDQDTP